MVAILLLFSIVLSEFVGETYLEVCACLKPLDHLLATRQRDVLLEDDVTIEDVIDFGGDAAMLIEPIARHEIERVQCLLGDIAQTRHTYRLDAGTLQIVEEGQRHVISVLKLGGISQVGICQIGRSPLQCTCGVGISTTLGQNYIGIHV